MALYPGKATIIDYSPFEAQDNGWITLKLHHKNGASSKKRRNKQEEIVTEIPPLTIAQLLWSLKTWFYWLRILPLLLKPYLTSNPILWKTAYP